MIEKEYIGDGVYAEFDQWGGLILTTEGNRIVLEVREWQALEKHVKEFWLARKRELLARTAGQEFPEVNPESTLDEASE